MTTPKIMVLLCCCGVLSRLNAKRSLLLAQHGPLRGLESQCIDNRNANPDSSPATV
jgi:hypothetical protein